jgi:formylglycine-generating enzyme required for sulfatase activity
MRACRTGSVGLADLALLAQAGLPLDEVAQLCGLHRVPAPQAVPAGGSQWAEASPSTDSAVQEERSPEVPPLLFWRETAREETTEQAQREVADRLAKVPLVERERFIRGVPRPLPGPQPLLPRAQLGAVIRQLLGDSRRSGPLHEEALARRVADCLPLQPLPRLKRWHWPRQVQVVFDRAARLAPLLTDQRWLLREITERLGKSTVRLAVVTPGGDVTWPGPGQGRYRLPMAGGTALVLGDLGGDCGMDLAEERWQVFGRQLRRQRVRAAALTPCPPSRLPDRTRSLWPTRYWDRRNPPKRPRSPEEREHRARRLLALLAGAVRIEPGVLRAARLLLPASGADVETELDAWSHDGLVASRSMGVLTVNPDTRPELRQSAEDLPSVLCQQAEHALVQWHTTFGPAVLAEELVEAYSAGLRANAGMDLLGLGRLLLERGPEPGGTPLGAWLRRWEWRCSPEDWQNPVRSLLWGCQHRERDGSDFDADLPEGLARKDIAWLLGQGTPNLQAVPIQRGSGLSVVDSLQLADRPSGEGAPLSRGLACLRPEATLRITGVDGATTYRTLELGSSESVPLPNKGRVALETDWATVRWEAVPPPAWAVGCRRSPAGLLVRAPMPVVEFADIPWPEGTMAWGHDPFGVWLDLPLAESVLMRLRWIPPGRFHMGSPADEKGRHGDERRHGVTIRRGFWLGETPCTQLQWEAVMGSNPSEHREAACPVETIGWGDCRAFCKTLASRMPTLDLRLPTEAEWEYACRAGSTSAFNDGSPCTEVTRRDPALDRLGWFDKNSGNETHRVGQKAPNTWGLHDMHGNVGEWCQDCAGLQGSKIVTDTYVDGVVDPLCAIGTWRVMRGGGCLGNAGLCRSACRGWDGPGSRNGGLGFRLAAGQLVEGGVPASGATGRAKEGAAAPGARDATSEARTARKASRWKSKL